ncbi:MAG: hypothetical protein ACRD8W_14920 [Nitrososphaeraceae archaeon]
MQQASSTRIHDITDGLRTDKTREEYRRAFKAFFRRPVKYYSTPRKQSFN